jgi:membrane protein
VGTIKTFAQKFSNDWSMNLVSMLTYSLITAIFPLLLGILSVAGIVLKQLPGNSFNQLVTSINNALPATFHQVVNVHNLLSNLVSITGPLAVVSLVALLWAGSNLFSSMENAFSIIFRVPDRDFLPQRIMGIGMVLIMAILLPLSLAASSLVTAGSAAFASVLPSWLGVALSVVGPLTALGILWLLFLAFYIIVPNIKVPFSDAWRGALAAAVLFGLLQLLFPLYFKLFLNGNAKYGAIAASALVLIAWLWLLALITIIGAQINAVAMGIASLPRDVPRTIAEDYKHTDSRQRPVTQGTRPQSRQAYHDDRPATDPRALG